ncbi:MAG: GNAT family N-acetyltransferase [Alteromonadaceae bacterium]|nr:GNAT family N-acetyltransferase [Alteromonadaceae bacterium]
MVEILKAEPAHAHEVKDLLKQLGYESQESQLLSVLSQVDANSEVFIAKKGSRVIALMSLIYFFYFPTQKSLCRITAIVVNENMRNTGVGKKLIQFAATQAASKSCAQLEVTTSLARKATQAYYERMGFKKASYRYYLNVGN